MLKNILFLVTFALPLQAQEKHSPTLNNYEKILKGYKRVTSEAFDLKSWQEETLIEKENKKEIPFSKLSDLEQKLFCLNSAARYNWEMNNLQEAWERELKKFKNPDHEINEKKSDDPKDKAALETDIESYLKELRTLREDFAKRHEKEMEKVFKDHKEVNEKEAKWFTNRVRKIHDEQKLIDRK